MSPYQDHEEDFTLNRKKRDILVSKIGQISEQSLVTEPSNDGPSKLSGYPLFFESAALEFPLKNKKALERVENSESCIEIARKRFEDELKLASAQKDRDLKDHEKRIESDKKEKRQ